MFKPTYLYVKRHNVTGLQYFGKTTSVDPYKYKGSGVQWTRHLKVHGNDVTTTIIGLFDDEVKCFNAAVDFSIKHDIVKSKEWANLKLETLDGGFDHIHSNNISKDYMKERWKNELYRNEMFVMSKASWTPERKSKKIAEREAYWTDERRLNMSSKMKGNQNSLGNKPPSRVHVNNGVDHKFMLPELVDSFLENNPSWVRGMPPRPKKG